MTDSKEVASYDKRRARKKMSWVALWAIVVLIPFVYFRATDLGINQKEVLIAVVYTLGAGWLTYMGVTAFERWTDNKHGPKE